MPQEEVQQVELPQRQPDEPTTNVHLVPAGVEPDVADDEDAALLLEDRWRRGGVAAIGGAALGGLALRTLTRDERREEMAEST